LLRIRLASLAYRAARALNGAPESFAEFDSAGRRPVEILTHRGDLFDWALSAVEGQERWHVAKPLPWAEGQARFFAGTGSFLMDYLASGEPVRAPIEGLVQDGATR